MKPNTESDRRPRRLPGPATASAAIQGIARAAVPPSRGSPGNGYRHSHGPPAARMHTGTVPAWHRRPA